MKFKYCGVEIVLVLDPVDGSIMSAQVPQVETDIWPILSDDVRRKALSLLQDKADEDYCTLAEGV